jgi:hypothetical protein
MPAARLMARPPKPERSRRRYSAAVRPLPVP